VLDSVRIHVGRVVDTKRWAHDLIGFLFDISDYLAADTSGLAEIPAYNWLAGFVKDVLSECPAGSRDNVLSSALNQSEGLLGPIAAVALLEAEINERPESEKVVSVDQLAALRQRVCERGLTWMKTDVSLEHRHFRLVINTIKGWSDQGKFRLALELLIKEDRNFKRFVARYLVRTETVAYGKVAGKPKYRYDFPALSRVTSVDEVWHRLRGVTILDEDPEEIKIALEVFLETIDAYRNRPEDWDHGRGRTVGV